MAADPRHYYLWLSPQLRMETICVVFSPNVHPPPKKRKKVMPPPVVDTRGQGANVSQSLYSLTQ